MLSRKNIFITLSFLFLFSCVNCSFLLGEENKDSPIIINGDNVEYSAENKEVVASGDIEVIYKGAKLTCRKLTVNMQTKDALAQGKARLEDEKGVIEGDEISYNFQNKTGVIMNAAFRANPYFGKARKAEKSSDGEIIVKRGYATTCSFDRPHYRIASKNIGLFPQDKIQTRESTLYLGSVPVAYLPRFNHSFKDPLMHVQLEPGKKKDWGLYMLSAWRYNITDNINGRAYLDYRSKLGLAEGFGMNYDTKVYGRGDYKFYYTDEKPDDIPKGDPSSYQRYFMRWRHKWNIEENTTFVSEFYKITDKRRKYDLNRNILKDYFFREYEKDAQPLSYALLHHAFKSSSIDILMQKRTNHWFDQLDKLPEIDYSLPSYQLWNSRFYFEDTSQLGNYNKKSSMSPATEDDLTVMRLDTTNKLALPLKVAFIEIKPYLASRQTFYDKGANDQTGIIRTVFSSGMDMSTKFYRIFDVKTGFLGMDINGLRHIITPSIAYEYRHSPTIPNVNIKQIDSVDSVTRGNTATLALSNKLQTKREGKTIDFVDFLITTDYVIKPKTGDNSILVDPTGKLKSNFSDILFRLKVLPYSWMRMEGEATYEHSDRGNENYDSFSKANYDVIFDLNKEQSISIGQRYERKGKNEVTAGFTWRITPKWKFSVYERYNFKVTDSLEKGFQEQQYSLTRDLHCWDLDISFNNKRTQGSNIFFTFRLKAFPENEFGFDQTVKESRSGQQ